MPNPTVYLSDDELEWVESQDGNRSATIRRAINRLRQEAEA